MCEISGCPNPAIAQGLCAKHYMRQRRTGDPTVTRKPGPNGTALRQENTALRQENTALRQKVTVLEQELAQQRAMAKRFLGNRAADVPSGKIAELRKEKGNKQQGLGMEALQAATAKATDAELIELDSFLMGEQKALRPAPRLEWTPGIPKEARQAIEALLLEHPSLSDNDRKALERFATYPAMDTGVWKKLKREPKGVAESVIFSAIYALGIFPLLPRPKPRSKKRAVWQRYTQYQLKYWVKHPHPTRGYDWMTLAEWAVDLRDALKTLRDVLAPISDEAWSRYWRGDPAMNTMDAAVSFLHSLYHCFLSIDEEHRSDLKRFQKVVRWDDSEAAQRARRESGYRCHSATAAHRSSWPPPARVFGQVMSAEMKEICGRPRRDVVAALTTVAFDLLDPLGSEDVRNWGRHAHR